MKTCFLQNKPKVNERLLFTCIQLLYDFYPSICFMKAFFQYLIEQKVIKKTHYFLGNLHELRDQRYITHVYKNIRNQVIQKPHQVKSGNTATSHSYKFYVCKTLRKAGFQFLNTTKYQHEIFWNVIKEQQYQFKNLESHFCQTSYTSLSKSQLDHKDNFSRTT